MSLAVLDEFAVGAVAVLGRGWVGGTVRAKRGGPSVRVRLGQRFFLRRAFGLRLADEAFGFVRVLALRRAAFFFALFGLRPSSLFRWAIDLDIFHVPLRVVRSDNKHYDTDALTVALVYVGS